MSRATLKLPAKSAAGDSWSPPRKPLRGGIKGKKASASSQRNPPLARPPLPVGERGGAGPRPPRAEMPARRSEGAARAPAPAARPENAPRDINRPRTDRGAAPADTAPAKKIYPKRGIARSTGARALPPPRVDRPAAADDHRADLPAPGAVAAPAAPAAAQPFLPSPAHAPAAPHADAGPRRVLAEPPRLAKRVAEMALCSRRQADEWIENGWVRVDGVVVTTLGVRVHAKAKIEITDAAKTHESVAVTIIYNRPPASADEAEPLPKSLIRGDNRWAEDETRVAFQATQLRGLAPAGKLDGEANGMLVLTQEGSVARRITGDATRLEKEYIVRVDGALDADGLARLSYGLELDGIKLKRAQVSWQNEQQLRFVLHETRKHQIARMCELVGLRVVSIKRIRIGSVSLGKLPAGQWRYLRDNERF